MKDLKSYARENKKFIKILNGDEIDVVYMGYIIGPNRFDPEKETVSYKFRYPNSDKTVIWNNGSTAVAEQMSKFQKGQSLRIRREGSGMQDTKYLIQALGEGEFGDAQE